MVRTPAPQVRTKTVSEVRLASVSFAARLDAGELLTGTVTVTEITTSDLTFTNSSVSTTALTIIGQTVPIGEAVQFKITGGTAGVKYVISINVATDSTPAQTLIEHVRLEITED